jgi:hypothetical protein
MCTTARSLPCYRGDERRAGHPSAAAVPAADGQAEGRGATPAAEPPPAKATPPSWLDSIWL